MPTAVQISAAKIRHASSRCVASRYCETSVRSARPDATIHQPTAPCSAPSAKISASFPAMFARDPAAPQKPHERQRKHHADQPRQQPMRPFPPVDRLELGQRHAEVALGVLRNGLIFFEFGLPGVRAQRRHDAGRRLPFGDREAGFRQPRRAADDHQQKYQRRHRQQPEPDRAVAAGAGAGCGAVMVIEGCVIAGRPYTAASGAAIAADIDRKDTCRA